MFPSPQGFPFFDQQQSRRIIDSSERTFPSGRKVVATRCEEITSVGEDGVTTTKLERLACGDCGHYSRLMDLQFCWRCGLITCPRCAFVCRGCRLTICFRCTIGIPAPQKPEENKSGDVLRVLEREMGKRMGILNGKGDVEEKEEGDIPLCMVCAEEWATPAWRKQLRNLANWLFPPVR